MSFLQRFKDLKIKFKLTLGFMAVALLTGGVGLIGVGNLNKVGITFEHLQKDPLVALVVVKELETHSLEAHLFTMRYMAGAVTEKKELQNLYAMTDQSFLKYKQIYQEAKTSGDSRAEEMGKWIAKDDIFREKRRALFASAIELKDSGTATEEDIQRKLTEMENLFGEREVLFQELDAIENEEVARRAGGVEDAIAYGKIYSYVGIILGFIIAIILGSFVSLPILKSVIQARNAAAEIARGNLDGEIDTTGKDEIGDLARAIAKMRDSLKAVLGEYEKRIK